MLDIATRPEQRWRWAAFTKPQGCSEEAADRATGCLVSNRGAMHTAKRARREKADRQHEFSALLSRPRALSPALRASIFELFETNMRRMYEGQGTWNRANKEEELWDDDSRFICLFGRRKDCKDKDDASGEDLAAFSMFRFDTEACARDDPLRDLFTPSRKLPVAYCYELQVSKAYHGLGLGSALVEALEHLGSRTGMVKSMLTVFETNIAAQIFYLKRGYMPDGICPTEEENAGYEILSKELADVDDDDDAE